MYLIYIIGNKGAGKTLLLVHYAFRTKRLVQANFHLKDIKYFKYITHVDLLNLQDNSIILLDEINKWLESRLSGDPLNIFIGNLLFETRKTFLDIIGTSVMYSTTDLRFREQADILIHTLPRLNRYDDFRYIYEYKEYGIKLEYTLNYELCEKYYFPLYNTFEKVKSARYTLLEFNVIKKEPMELLNKVIEISKIIKPQLNEITHDSINALLLLNGIHTGYEKYVYSYLKKKIKV